MRRCLAAVVVTLALTIAASSAGASEYQLDSVSLAFVLTEPTGTAHEVRVRGERVGTIAPGSREAVFAVSRRQLAADGELTVHVGANRAERLDGWVHLLPRPTDPAATPDLSDERALRPRSLAYTRLSGLDHGGTLRLGHRSHEFDGRVDASANLTDLELDGELLAGALGSTLVPGDLAMRSRDGGPHTTHVRWLHDGANPLELTIRRDGDRLRYSYEYRVARSIDRAVPVTTRFALPGGFAAFESLRWRGFDRVSSNRPPQFRADPEPGDEPLSMSQYPFLAARSGSGTYIGVLDGEGSSLFGRVDEADDAFDVEMWLWPRTVGQTYRWSFEVLAGHEPYANAFLRAFAPRTARNTSDVRGGVMNPGVFFDSVEDARRAYALGVRETWLHHWFFRNGLYFQADQPMGAPYTSINGRPFSYDQLREQVRIAQAAGLKVNVYFQFAGVSADVADRFSSSLVRDPFGGPVVAGADGGIDNLWANPDPDGPYGRSFLDQMDRLLGVIKPDGIAMDRGDRLDFTYASGYDYGSFDGYASPRLPEAEPKPASSITRGGVAMYERLRQVVHKHRARLFTNLPTAVPAIANSDMTRIDQPMTPWSLFFMRAASNGKPSFILDRTAQGVTTAAEKCEGNTQLARLARVHPTLFEGCVEPFADTFADPRLQYVIPTGDPYPTYWLFQDGTSIFSFDSARQKTGERYAGSTFVPLGDPGS